MTIPHNTHNVNYERGELWIFGLGSFYLCKKEANKHKDQHTKEYLKCFEFYGKIWWQRFSSHALKNAIKSGYKPI